MTSTLTREALLGKAKPRYEEVDVPGFGVVGIQACSELRRSHRISKLFDANGNRLEIASVRRRVHMIIDQVMVKQGEPMFQESDVDVLLELDSEKLDPLVHAINNFNDEIEPEKKESGGSSDTSDD